MIKNLNVKHIAGRPGVRATKGAQWSGHLHNICDSDVGILHVRCRMVENEM